MSNNTGSSLEMLFVLRNITMFSFEMPECFKDVTKSSFGMPECIQNEYDIVIRTQDWKTHYQYVATHEDLWDHPLQCSQVYGTNPSMYTMLGEPPPFNLRKHLCTLGNTPLRTLSFGDLMHKPMYTYKNNNLSLYTYMYITL